MDMSYFWRMLDSNFILHDVKLIGANPPSPTTFLKLPTRHEESSVSISSNRTLCRPQEETLPTYSESPTFETCL